MLMLTLKILYNMGKQPIVYTLLTDLSPSVLVHKVAFCEWPPLFLLCFGRSVVLEQRCPIETSVMTEVPSPVPLSTTALKVWTSEDMNLLPSLVLIKFTL